MSCWGSLLPLLRIKPLHAKNLHFHSLEGDPGVRVSSPPLPQVPKESGPQHPALGSQVPRAGLPAAPLPPGGASESPTPMVCQVGKRTSPSKALGAGRGVPTQPPSVRPSSRAPCWPPAVPPPQRIEEPGQERCVYSQGHGWGCSEAWAGLGLGSGLGSGSGLASSGSSSQGKVGIPLICSR